MKKWVSGLIFIIFSISAQAQVIPADSASNYINETVTVYGEVTSGRFLSGSNKKPTLLNMGGKYPNQKMTIVIYGDSRANFGYQPEVHLLNKVVYVKGKVELYNNKPQIVVSTPFEISLNPPANFAAQNAATNFNNAGKGETKSKKLKKERRENNETQSGLKVRSKEEAKTVNATTQNETLTSNTDITLESSVSLKGGPGNKFTTVGSLKKGTVVRIISLNYGWAKIAEKNSKKPLTGYVKVENLQ